MKNILMVISFFGLLILSPSVLLAEAYEKDQNTTSESNESVTLKCSGGQSLCGTACCVNNATVCCASGVCLPKSNKTSCMSDYGPYCCEKTQNCCSFTGAPSCCAKANRCCAPSGPGCCPEGTACGYLPSQPCIRLGDRLPSGEILDENHPDLIRPGQP